MKLFKSKKWRILAIVVIVFVVSVIAAIWHGSVSRTDGTPLLSTNVVDTGFVNIGDHYKYYPSNGALYIYTESGNSVVIKCRSAWGTKNVAKVDKKITHSYIIGVKVLFFTFFQKRPEV